MQTRILFFSGRTTEGAEENTWGRKMFRQRRGAKIEKKRRQNFAEK